MFSYNKNDVRYLTQLYELIFYVNLCTTQLVKVYILNHKIRGNSSTHVLAKFLLEVYYKKKKKGFDAKFIN